MYATGRAAVCTVVSEHISEQFKQSLTNPGNLKTFHLCVASLRPQRWFLIQLPCWFYQVFFTDFIYLNVISQRHDYHLLIVSL